MPQRAHDFGNSDQAGLHSERSACRVAQPHSQLKLKSTLRCATRPSVGASTDESYAMKGDLAGPTAIGVHRRSHPLFSRRRAPRAALSLPPWDSTRHAVDTFALSRRELAAKAVASISAHDVLALENLARKIGVPPEALRRECAPPTDPAPFTRTPQHCTHPPFSCRASTQCQW